MHVSADICKLMQTYATYVNLCNILKSSKIIFTAFPETYTLVRRLMQLMQTYATYANICKLMQNPEIL